ncbi:MAG: cupin domain-containing protein [Candidatus Bathyarchaeia archaeon]
MQEADLPKLTALVKEILRNRKVLDIIVDLKTQLLETDEPFVWATLPENLIGKGFPTGIRSAWIFVLKPHYRTSPHYHPNSIQHTAVIEGDGRAKIGDQQIKLELFNLNDPQPSWYIIEKGVSHEFVTGKSPVVVISFHTCAADDLVEVEKESGRMRLYERKS